MTVRRFFGGLLIAVGVLWMALSGACTLAVILGPLLGDGVHPESFAKMFASLLPWLFIGLAALSPGIAFLFAGRALLRTRDGPR
jgi:hypothetical protein